MQPLVKDIIAWKAVFPLCRISHVYQEANQAKDSLASHALNGSFVFHSDPLSTAFIVLLQANAMQTTYLCHVWLQDRYC